MPIDANPSKKPTSTWVRSLKTDHDLNDATSNQLYRASEDFVPAPSPQIYLASSELACVLRKACGSVLAVVGRLDFD